MTTRLMMTAAVSRVGGRAGVGGAHPAIHVLREGLADSLLKSGRDITYPFSQSSEKAVQVHLDPLEQIDHPLLLKLDVICPLLLLILPPPHLVVNVFNPPARVVPAPHRSI